MLEDYKLAALVGTGIFLLSGVLPLISLSLFDFSYYFGLLDTYNLVIQGSSSWLSITATPGSVGIRLLIILYPIALILGIVSIFRRKIAAVTGMLGLACWIGWGIYLIELQEISYAGLAFYVGLLGAATFLVAYKLKPTMTVDLVPPKPTSPSKPTGTKARRKKPLLFQSQC